MLKWVFQTLLGLTGWFSHPQAGTKWWHASPTGWHIHDDDPTSGVDSSVGYPETGTDHLHVRVYDRKTSQA